MKSTCTSGGCDSIARISSRHPTSSMSGWTASVSQWLSFRSTRQNARQRPIMRSGDRCQCGLGRLRVYSVRTSGGSRTQYLVCRACRATGKATIAIDELGRPFLAVGAMRSKNVLAGINGTEMIDRCPPTPCKVLLDRVGHRSRLRVIERFL